MASKKSRDKAAELILADLSLLTPESLADLESRMQVERARRREEAQKARQAEAEKFNQFVFKNKDRLVRLFPKHSGNGTDTQTCYDSYVVFKCPRCFLLHMEEWQLTSVELKFGLEVEQI